MPDGHAPGLANGPEAFERAVASVYRRRGYETEVRGGSHDWGVDVFASKKGEKLAIQAKMYRGARPVNRRHVLELYGAAAYFDCTGSVVATDGVLTPDARAAAEKLGVWIEQIRDWDQVDEATSADLGSAPSFDSIWENRIMPLAGRVLTRSNGTANTIVAVDWAGLTRITSGGNRQHLPIEIFRSVISRVLRGETVSRSQINDEFPGRASSGIVLILREVVEFTIDSRHVIRVR